MTCDSAHPLLSAYFDRELDAGEDAEVAAHVKTCADCAEALDRLRSLSAAIHDPGLRYAPPAYLEAKVLGAVRKSAVREIKPRSPLWVWAAAAACFLLSVALTWSLLLQRSRTPSEQTIAQEVVSSHIRSLQATHLFDVPSTDRHTVKPWFDGKLDFSPDVKDLADQGFRLAGGRLDYIDGETVAALVFQRRLHVINVFVWPTTGKPSRPVESAPRNGYNLMHWTHAGMNYWAVADIPDTELEEFARLYDQ